MNDDAADSDAANEAAESDDAIPLSDLAERVSDRRAERRREREQAETNRSADGDANGSSGSPFDEMSVAEIDEETLWSSLDDPDGPASRVGAGEPADPISESDPDASEHVVAKADYCQRCPHLSDPPELACTHEGTEIVAVEGAERFRVRNCPMVEE